jgi:hydrogenase nickel incorporation protein HypA/HybF
MHELSVLQSIVGVVLRHCEDAGATRVLAIDLEVGELRDLDEECMQRYLEFVSAGTPAAGATLRVRRQPVLFSCRSCGATVTADLRSGEPIVCTSCSSTDVELSGGHELRIESIDVT